MRKDTKKLIRNLERQGWRVEQRGSLIQAYSPDGATLISFHSTESDHRAMRNTIARLRKGGYDPDA